MFFWQIGFFLLLAEAAFALLVIDEIGFFQTLCLWIASALLGGAILRRQGLETMLRAQKAFDAGVLPVAEIFDGICLMLAGLLLILPGFLSDIMAFLLLIPQIRSYLKPKLGRHFNLKETKAYYEADIIEGTYERIEEQAPKIEGRNAAE